MGNTIWLQVTDGTTTTGGENDHSFPLLLEKELEALTQRLGVAPLSSFYDYSALAEELAEDLGEETPGKTWFAPAAGLAVTSVLVRELRARPEALGFKAAKSTEHWPASLLSDLESLHAGLEDAAARGLKFRFLIVP